MKPKQANTPMNFPLFLWIAAFTGAVAFTPAPAADNPDRDRFGGWTGRQSKATGFFRLEKGRERWWMVTPEGNAYLIHGMDHVGQELVNQPYNRDYWKKELGLPDGASQKERVDAFYRKKVAQDRAYLGFNCLYSHQPPMGLNVCPYIPRVRTLDIEYWRTSRAFSEENFLDVFSEGFVARCTQTAKQMLEPGRVQDPWIVGLALTDSPLLTVQMAMPHRPGFFHRDLPGTTTWPVRLRNLGAGAAAKQRYVSLMKQRYEAQIEKFNA